MVDLDDPIWGTLIGGYRIPYDASSPLKRLLNAQSHNIVIKILDELWNELHHQKDVDSASYYAVPHLIEIAKLHAHSAVEILNLIITIEIERHENNPPVPNEILSDYENAISMLGAIGESLIAKEWDLSTASTALSAIALSKNQVGLGKAIMLLGDEDVLSELVENY